MLLTALLLYLAIVGIVMISLAIAASDRTVDADVWQSDTVSMSSSLGFNVDDHRGCSVGVGPTTAEFDAVPIGTGAALAVAPRAADHAAAA